jgi:outer membrane protein assembly factor BamE (lipoprotein component of BamABCDE complex)
MTMRKFLVPFGTVLIGFGLTACEPVIAERGNMVDPDRLKTITVGSSSKDDVIKAIGSPTAMGTFDENAWYYMGQRTSQESFFDPEVTDRRIVEIDFDKDDKVTKIKQSGLGTGNDIEMVDQITPAEGHETTLAEELFGRPSADSDKKKKKDDQ